MRKLFFALSLLTFCVIASAQQLRQITFSGASALSYFSFVTDQGVLIRVSEDGHLMEWGSEVQSQRSDNYYAPNLQPFTGRIDYYGAETVDSTLRGKVKSIGTCAITYYGEQDKDEKPGKLKSIGRTMIDYYTQFENAAFKGKMKFAGTTLLQYYASLENEALRGKLKAVGGTTIQYHTTFDDKLIQGKIKTIGSVAYNWGTSLDPNGQRGALKSGQYRQNINGIIYILH